ncbi:Uncharacterized protein FWK35_00005224 [Aphis craccivora]|uniref:Uncharacterized protein n=1 Tax=Aphis craccivora TaxID=307492 RepID=A0A6G0ZEU2_APHCR|nr:Uncharacterized protein FWK35_00005224 [Aphis craccivora]
MGLIRVIRLLNTTIFSIPKDQILHEKWTSICLSIVNTWNCNNTKVNKLKKEEIVKGDSERSDECIDFTMMCFFFCVCHHVLEQKVNLVGNLTWGVRSKKFPIVFKIVRKNPKKVTEKREFLRKTSFQPNRFFYMVVNQKLITVYVSVIYIHVDKKILDDQKYKSNNFFLLAFEIQILTKIRQNDEYLQIIFHSGH